MMKLSPIITVAFLLALVSGCATSKQSHIASNLLEQHPQYGPYIDEFGNNPNEYVKKHSIFLELIAPVSDECVNVIEEMGRIQAIKNSRVCKGFMDYMDIDANAFAVTLFSTVGNKIDSGEMDGADIPSSWSEAMMHSQLIYRNFLAFGEPK